MLVCLADWLLGSIFVEWLLFVRVCSQVFVSIWIGAWGLFRHISTLYFPLTGWCNECVDALALVQAPTDKLDAALCCAHTDDLDCTCSLVQAVTLLFNEQINAGGIFTTQALQFHALVCICNNTGNALFELVMTL